MSDEQTKANRSETSENGTPGTREAGDGVGSRSSGIIQGVPGRHIEASGVVDLRGVPAEKVAQIESIRSSGVILLDEQNRNALDGVSVESSGAIVVAEPGLQVLVEPWREFSKASLEAMAAGQKLMLVGITFFRPDVPPALVSEKFEALQVVGVLLACQGVHGALLGKGSIIGVTATIPEDMGPLVHALGETDVTPGYLSHLADGIGYLNIGMTRFSEDVTEDLVARKIATYLNIGCTEAPGPLLDLLKARCPTNLGRFQEPGKDESEEGDEQAPAAAP